MAKDIIADGMKKQNHCDTCLNQHTDKCNHCMVTEYHGQRVSNPTGYEQKPCETSTDEPMTMVYPTIFCDDAISREAALEKMADYVSSGYADSAEDFEEYSKIICQLPSVQPSRKGHWIYIGNSEVNGLKICECDNCHKRAYGSTDFCPNCGADMRGDTE